MECASVSTLNKQNFRIGELAEGVDQFIERFSLTKRILEVGETFPIWRAASIPFILEDLRPAGPGQAAIVGLAALPPLHYVRLR